MKINIMKNKRQQLENILYLIQKKQEYLINENQFLKNKLFESQTKKKDLCYIFFSMVENLFPEFSFIKKQCLYFINSNSVSISNIENNTQNILSAEQKHVTSDLISKLGVKSVEFAKYDIIEELKNNPHLHDKFIEESIAKLDEVVL